MALEHASKIRVHESSEQHEDCCLLRSCRWRDMDQRLNPKPQTLFCGEYAVPESRIKLSNFARDSGPSLRMKNSKGYSRLKCLLQMRGTGTNEYPEEAAATRLGEQREQQ